MQNYVKARAASARATSTFYDASKRRLVGKQPFYQEHRKVAAPDMEIYLQNFKMTWAFQMTHMMFGGSLQQLKIGGGCGEPCVLPG